MAGDWMKIELELSDKPEVHYIAGAIGMDPDAVVGKLVRVWAWFDKHTENGHAFGVTFVTLDKLVSVTGFGEAMQFAGWLEQKDKYLVMPNFDRHNGESAKKRGLAQKRKSRQRHAPTVTKTGPEKRREEVKEAEPTGSMMVWNHGLKLLQAQGMQEQEARSFVGMLLGKYEADVILDAMTASAGKTDAKSYVLAILKTKAFKGEKKMRVAL